MTGVSYVGENLYKTSAAESGGQVVDATQAWYGEEAYYDHDLHKCAANAVCGHYTQVSSSEHESHYSMHTILRTELS